MKSLPCAVLLLLVPQSSPEAGPLLEEPPAQRTSEGYPIPPAPEAPTGPASPELAAALERAFRALERNLEATPEDVVAIASHGDARTAWIFADMLRFARGSGLYTDSLRLAFEGVTGTELPVEDWTAVWKTTTDFLIAWDLPAFPDYAAYKERLYVALEPGWAPFFDDDEPGLDWRHVTWGGVFIDDRPFGEQEPCERGCIPALDEPAVTDAEGGAWYPDARLVFGIALNGEARAYPKHQMETHEMVNDTLGGRRLAIPYCTLCGSAQAYFVDDLPDGVATPVLRTSGLLSRSNKVMYDLHSKSVFDTFTGEALTGPLRKLGVRLEQAPVVTSTWAAWKRAHPETTILAKGGGLDRLYSLDPLGDRDANGPIFPVGDVDPRLPVQEPVLGIELPGGRALAFPIRSSVEALERGEPVALAGVHLEQAGSGLLARDAEGTLLPTHSSFWFAWSQFWPKTELWKAPD